MTNCDDLSILFKPPFDEAVKKLEDLTSQSGRAFLIGAGCSKCAGLPLMPDLTAKALGSNSLDDNAREILQGLQAIFTGATDANIEDYLSELIDLLAIAERRAERGATNNEIELNGKSYTSMQLRDAAEKIKRAIAEVIDCKVEIEIHCNFIRAVHRPQRPGNIANQRVDYLCLNYDTLLEDALALERISYSDGLDGGVTGWWNPHNFHRKDLAARILKLHGSLDWCEFQDDPLPRRVGKSVNIKSIGDHRILIWPASTKYRETQLDPYAQLADLARKVLRPEINSHLVLIVCGYRFGDSHINHEIDRALRETSKRLTVVVFTSEDQPTGQLKRWNEDPVTSEQVLIFANRGFFHGNQSKKSDVDLMWWKFENITRILGGER